jgi:hypothetical protein
MVFTVSHAGIRLKVRLLPTVRDVHREYTGGKRAGGGKVTHAFFHSGIAPNRKTIGTVILPSNGRLAELIPHEVSHAVLHKVVMVNRDDDEAYATAVGVLSARIARRISRKYEVRYA